MRIRGSVRFAPYYKVEYFDPSVVAWRPIQKAHATQAAAVAAPLPAGATRRRVYEVSPSGRRVVAEAAHAPAS